MGSECLFSHSISNPNPNPNPNPDPDPDPNPNPDPDPDPDPDPNQSTMCLKFAGGDGCEGEQAAGKGDGAAGQLMASAMSALRALDNATAHANATIHR